MLGSVNDDEPFKHPQIRKMVTDFAELTMSPLWRIVIFHSRDQSFSVSTALKARCHAVECLTWVKTNVNHSPLHRFVSATECITVGYYDEVSKRRVREHCNENGISNVLMFPAVTKKLRHVAGDMTLVNPYQKPRKLIMRLLQLFSNDDDWVLDLFSGTGTTLACSLNMFRHCIAMEKDDAQVSFIRMRINGLNECPDEDQEVGRKHIADTERFQPASREPVPPLADEPRDMADLEEPILEQERQDRCSNVPEDPNILEPEESYDQLLL
ncbi:hypothetical protein KP509_15G027200 [Ceratopteris richardii]|uniref:DNA methylase N-4/N-6 domain-containing protein n=1 Tax=Ceratopteris richardii TaxID=49495 RepID=A0A8T2T7Z2_CERRI|nr:hypothetical protein KP509_15G027200 [Ceratopteris richardii]